MFLAIISPSSSCSSYSWNEWSVRHFSFHNKKNSISSPGLLGGWCIIKPVEGCIFDVISSLNTKFFQGLQILLMSGVSVTSVSQILESFWNIWSQVSDFPACGPGMYTLSWGIHEVAVANHGHEILLA